MPFYNLETVPYRHGLGRVLFEESLITYMIDRMIRYTKLFVVKSFSGRDTCSE